MNRAALFVLGSFCGGCLVVPATKTSTKPTGTELGAMTFTSVRETKLEATVNERTVHVHGTRIGECVQPVYAISEVTSQKKLAMGGASDPRARAFGFVFSPVTIPLFPGHPFSITDLAWSEIHYKAYSCRFPAVAAEVTRR
jgi:hypothetical protein